MPLWIWIVTSLAGILALSFFLFQVRYAVEWQGGLRWSATFSYGFPGFLRVFHFPTKPSTKSSAPPTRPPPAAPVESKTAPPPSKPSIPPRSRGRSLLVKLVKDIIVLRALFRYGIRFTGLSFRLLNLELNCAVGHSDPARLGRMAGYWYAAEPLLPAHRIHLHFRFQDQSSTLRLSARGGFSAAGAVAYAFAIFFSFPWFTLSRRAWHGWRNS